MDKVEVIVVKGGGDQEAWDVTRILAGMYHKWGEKKGHSPDTRKEKDSYVVTLEGERLLEVLKKENGIHRICRSSPFDATGRRYTSFLTVIVQEAGGDIPSWDTEEGGKKIREWGEKHIPKFSTWGGDVRTYVFQPVALLHDRVTGYKDKDPEGFLEGDLDRVLQWA